MVYIQFFAFYLSLEFVNYFWIFLDLAKFCLVGPVTITCSNQDTAGTNRDTKKSRIRVV